MATFVESVLGVLVDVSLKSLLLAIAAGAVLAVFRVRNSNLRHRVWTAVLVGMLSLPLLVWVTPAVPLPAWSYPRFGSLDVTAAPSTELAAPQSIETPTAARIGDTGDVTSMAIADAALEFSSKPQARTSDLSTTEYDQSAIRLSEAPSPTSVGAGVQCWPLVLVAVYASAATFLIARLLIALRTARAIVAGARRISLPVGAARLSEGTEVRESTVVRVPVTVGIWRPCILLPSDWKAWDEPLLASVLSHEQAHVSRRDPCVAVLAELNRAVYWYHPVAWFLRWRLATLAESACDDSVIETQGDRSEYARHLLDIAARMRGERGRLELAGVAMARVPHVERRIDAILDATRPLSRRLGKFRTFGLWTVAMALSLFVASLHAEQDIKSASNAPANAEGNTPSKSDANNSSEPIRSNAATSELRGRVVMESDASAVADAEVRLVSWKESRMQATFQKTRTKADGTFVFEKVPDGKHQMKAFFGDFASRQAMFKSRGSDVFETPRPSSDSITLTLAKAPKIEVQVVDKAGNKPIADALVRLVWTDTERDHRTDDRGRVVLRGLTHETWHVEVQAKGFAEREEAVNLTETDSANLTFELEPGGVLLGAVRDEQGTPIEEAGFSIFPANYSGGQIEYLKTDEQGRFRFEYLPIDKGLELSVSKDGYVALRQQTTLADAPGHERELNLVLERRPHGGSLRGIVSDKDGNPIIGAKIDNYGKSSREVRAATTDERGEFLLDDVYEGSLGHEFVIHAKGFAPQQLAFRPGTREAPTEMNLKLDHGHRIHGRVVDEFGKPIGGVRIYFADGDAGIMPLGGRTTTDSNGKFSFDSLPENTPFKFVASGYSEIEDKKLPLDGDDEVVVTMEPQGIIRGRVVDAVTGQPITLFDVRITFSPDRKPDDPGNHLSGARATSPTGERFDSEDGQFVIDDLIRNMPLQVTVMAEGYDRRVLRRIVANVAGETETVEIRMAPLDESNWINLRGQIVDGDGAPMSGAELCVVVSANGPEEPDAYPFNWQMIRFGQLASLPETLQYMSATSDGDGRFAFDRVRNGKDIEIVYWGEGISKGRIQRVHELSKQEQQNIKIQNVEPGIVHGVVDRGKLPTATRISLSSKDGAFDPGLGSELAADQSRYEIRNVPPGSYELQVYGNRRRTGLDSHTHDVIVRRDIEIRSGETLEIDLGNSTAANRP